MSGNVWAVVEALKQSLKEGEQVSLIAEGNSMLPLIRGGRDRLFLKALDQESFIPGSILLFVFGDKLVAHRLVGVEGELLIFHGDGNVRCYEHCQRGAAFAEVKAIQRGRLHIQKDDWKWNLHRLLWPRRVRIRRLCLALYKYLFHIK